MVRVKDAHTSGMAFDEVIEVSHFEATGLS